MKHNCITHGEWDSNRATACPDCMVDARRELATLRNRLNSALEALRKAHHCTPIGFVHDIAGNELTKQERMEQEAAK